jgi:hypothetical protein
VNKSDEFRRYADECLRMADKTNDEGDKGAWLRLAESWLRMIQSAPDYKRAPADKFDTRDKAQGTRHRPSYESH